VLEGAKAPTSVIEKTVSLAGMIFEMGGAYNGTRRHRIYCRPAKRSRSSRRSSGPGRQPGHQIDGHKGGGT